MRKRRRNSYMLPGVLGVEVSDNAKLGLCSATYITQRTCPDSCPFLEKGCYYEAGHSGIIARRLNEAAEALELTPDEVISNEGVVIRKLSGQLPLRLHVGGDVTTVVQAQLLAKAVDQYTKKYGQSVWGYTHAWRDIPREAWGPEVSMLASCETPGEVLRAMEAGYAVALVVRELGGKRFRLEDFTVLACPEQLGQTGTDCSRCRLCFDDQRLLSRRLVIGFVPHGAGASRVRVSLPVLEA